MKYPVLYPMSYTASPCVCGTTYMIPLRNHAPPRHGVFSGLDITPLLHTINMVHWERCETNIHGFKPIVRALSSVGSTVCWRTIHAKLNVHAFEWLYVYGHTILKQWKAHVFSKYVIFGRPPLWSSGQSSRLQTPRSRVRLPVLPDFLRSSGSGTGSTQPREDNWRATWMKK
jgi:hypothetical protein